MSLPTERPNRQIRIDTFHFSVVDAAVRGGADAAERDAFRGQRLLDAVSRRLCPPGCVLQLCMELGAHLAGERGDRPESEQVRSVALIRGAGVFTVTAEEGVLRLCAGAIGPALRVAAEAPKCIGPSGLTLVDAAELRRVVDRLAVRAAASPA